MSLVTVEMQWSVILHSETSYSKTILILPLFVSLASYFLSTKCYKMRIQVVFWDLTIVTEGTTFLQHIGSCYSPNSVTFWETEIFSKLFWEPKILQALPHVFIGTYTITSIITAVHIRLPLADVPTIAELPCLVWYLQQVLGPLWR